jgi:hypothetical protein
MVFGFDIHGDVATEHAASFARAHVGDAHLFDLMGVDGLIVPSRVAAALDADPGPWRRAAQRDDAVIYHRTIVRAPITAVNAVRAVASLRSAAVALRRAPEGAPVLEAPEAPRLALARLREVRATRLGTEAQVEASREADALLVFARPWYPGFVATFNGRTLPVLRVDGLMPAVRIAAGSSGRLVLRYRPWALRVGVPLSATALLLVVVCGALSVRARRP